MKITQYDLVASLVAGDVFLIDGERGTKRLQGEYIKSFAEIITNNYRTSDGHTPQYRGNLNDITTNTTYNIKIADVTNAPSGAGSWGFLITYTHSNPAYITQVYLPMMSINDGISFRIKNNGSWSAWTKICKMVDIVPAWSSNRKYYVNEVVSYNDNTYICKATHTSSSTIIPTNATYWTAKKVGDILYDLFNKFNDANTKFSQVNARLDDANSEYSRINQLLQTTNSNINGLSSRITALSTDVSTVRTDFQDGVDKLTNACKNKGFENVQSTPTGIASVINALTYVSHDTISITANGTYDVARYGKANVQVPIGDRSLETLYIGIDNFSHPKTINTSKYYPLVAIYYSGDESGFEWAFDAGVNEYKPGTGYNHSHIWVKTNVPANTRLYIRPGSNGGFIGMFGIN